MEALYMTDFYKRLTLNNRIRLAESFYRAPHLKETLPKGTQAHHVLREIAELLLHFHQDKAHLRALENLANGESPEFWRNVLTHIDELTNRKGNHESHKSELQVP